MASPASLREGPRAERRLFRQEHAAIGAIAAPRSAAVEAPALPASTGAFRALYRRARLAGGIAFCLLSLGACLLVARRLSDASWPLEGAHVPLVFLAGGAYLASFGDAGRGQGSTGREPAILSRSRSEWPRDCACVDHEVSAHAA
jgi:hypothetical protein